MNKDITVILNVYNRPHTLEPQLEAIKNQSVGIPDENIWVWYNKGTVKQAAPKNPNHRIFVCNQNTKFHGRFAAAMLVQTKYVGLFDDDVLPGVNWFKNCLETMEVYNGLLGGSGVVLPNTTSYNSNQKIGWNGVRSSVPINVDLVGHAWFWKSEWSKYMWYEQPVSWDNGEDIMFSYLLQKHGKIKTWVPPHPEDDITVWSCDPNFGFKHGNDASASWLHNNNHNNVRDHIVRECCNNGWIIRNH